MTKEGKKIRILFDHTGSGLASRDGERLTWFEVAGEDKQFKKASALIEGDTVVVECEEVPDPKAVRFGWHQDAEPNLMNKEGLPASPFRTYE
jgi:sialate O-acetylesterase